jgi:hypothetical protein
MASVTLSFELTSWPRYDRRSPFGMGGEEAMGRAQPQPSR